MELNFLTEAHFELTNATPDVCELRFLDNSRSISTIYKSNMHPSFPNRQLF